MVAITQDIINKIQNFTTNIVEKMNSIIATHNIDSSAHSDKQLKDNLVTSWGNVTSDTKYPSEKLVYSTFQNLDLSGETSVADEAGTFSELQDLIDEAESGSVITLDKDYKYQENDSRPIYITKDLTVIGNGHTLIGNKQESIIIVMPYSRLTQSGVQNYFCLYDTVITKGGGANSSISGVPPLKIIGCTFIDNSSGAIDICSGIIKDCNFISNNNSRYSIVNIKFNLTSMENCTFIGNKYTGEDENQVENIYSVNEINVYNCVFIDGSNYNVKNITYPDLTEEWYEFYDDMAN